MKIFHLADLHIGKIVNGFSMLKQQQYILEKVIYLVKTHKPKVLIIAGDIYDKHNPSNSAAILFSNFIEELSQFDLDILIVSGNHDSGQKLQFASGILSRQRIFISGSFDGKIDEVSLKDNFGTINFYLMPFVRPSDVRVYFPDVSSYHNALETVLNNSDIDYNKRNVFIGHQFFGGGISNVERSDSELISVGGIDNVGYNLLEKFDYAALGHLHKPQKLVFDYIRYSGSPLKYSESEVSHQKSIVMLDIMEKNNVKIELLELKPEIEMRKIEGYINDILNDSYDLDKTNDYVHITLLDEGEVINAINKIRNKYPNVMTLKFKNIRSQNHNDINVRDDISETNPIDLFNDFFKLQNNREMNESQRKTVERLIGKENV